MLMKLSKDSLWKYLLKRWRVMILKKNGGNDCKFG